MRCYLWGLAFVGACLADGLYADILHVDSTALSGGDGSAWNKAFSDLQHALRVAQPADEVWVAAGVYKPTPAMNRTISFEIPGGVAILGGFSGHESSSADRNPHVNTTTLSGDLASNDGSGTSTDTHENSLNVVMFVDVGRTTILDGFTVTGGNGTTHDENPAPGGGVLIYGSSPVIRNCQIVDNQAGDACLLFDGAARGASGGGVACFNGSSPLFENCFFGDNRAGKGDGDDGVCGDNSNCHDPLYCDGPPCPNGGGGGGAVFTEASSAEFVRCDFVRNAGGRGRDIGRELHVELKQLGGEWWKRRRHFSG